MRLGWVSTLVKRPALPIALVILSATVWMATASGSQQTVEPKVEETSTPVFMAEGLQRVSSQTASDWANAADAVVAADVIEETSLGPGVSETVGRGGADLVGRTVSLRIDKVLWRAPEVAVSVPDTLEVNAFGWMQDTRLDGKRVPVVTHGTARLEVGHTYVIALAQLDPACRESEALKAVRWSPIGAGGILPADEGVIGNGEYEASPIEVADVKSLPLPKDSMLVRFSGKSASGIAVALDGAARHPVAFQPPCG